MHYAALGNGIENLDLPQAIEPAIMKTKIIGLRRRRSPS
jgi:hypothetical protein